MEELNKKLVDNILNVVKEVANLFIHHKWFELVKNAASRVEDCDVDQNHEEDSEEAAEDVAEEIAEGVFYSS